MAKISIVYGSTMGATEAAAQTLAGLLGATATPIAQADAATFEADLVLLGSSTWGYGELQDDWAAGIALLDAVDLTGRQVAVFGTGDQCGFSDTYANALGILADKAVERGATLVGQTPSAGYRHSASLADRDGRFVGLALDDVNEPEKTPERLAAWAEPLAALVP